MKKAGTKEKTRYSDEELEDVQEHYHWKSLTRPKKI